METLNDLRLAVLIDADNIPYGNVKGMLEEIAKYGTPTFKRIYGDWTRTTISGWKSVLLENAITPVQQYGYTKGKNSTDSAMIIDAMDILYSGKVDGFCLVSSDSDFTRLATRLREAGMKVIGIGERKTPSPFIIACDKFIYLEIINSSSGAADSYVARKKPGKPARSKPRNEESDQQVQIRKAKNLIASSITDLADENGWAYLGDVGNLILKKQPDFDPRNYGFTKLTPLIRSLDFEIDERDSGQNNIRHIYIRNKKIPNPS
jgi:Fe-S-cluster formation regulator IscX/YfhJ